MPGQDGGYVACEELFGKCTSPQVHIPTGHIVESAVGQFKSYIVKGDVFQGAFFASIQEDSVLSLADDVAEQHMTDLSESGGRVPPDSGYVYGFSIPPPITALRGWLIHNR